MNLIDRILNEAQKRDYDNGKKTAKTAKRIGLDEFKRKVEDAIGEKEEGDEEVQLNLYNLTPTINDDLDTVIFNFENTEWRDGDGFSDLPCGYKELKDGMPVLFVNAGGDWETPIAFILYWDGKDVRGYVPVEGNTFDKEIMTAYGNDTDAPKDLKPDVKAMENEIMDRIELVD